MDVSPEEAPGGSQQRGVLRARLGQLYSSPGLGQGDSTVLAAVSTLRKKCCFLLVGGQICFQLSVIPQLCTEQVKSQAP